MSLQDFKLENSHSVSSSILDLKEMHDDELMTGLLIKVFTEIKIT